MSEKWNGNRKECPHCDENNMVMSHNGIDRVLCPVCLGRYREEYEDARKRIVELEMDLKSKNEELEAHHQVTKTFKQFYNEYVPYRVMWKNLRKEVQEAVNYHTITTIEEVFNCMEVFENKHLRRDDDEEA